MGLAVVGRTADQIITNDPFPVAFGEKTFKVKRLTIGKGKEWRTRVIEHDKSIAGLFTDDDPTMRVLAVSEKAPDLILELVQQFLDSQAGDKVTREQLEEGTDEQLLAAYDQMLLVTFPNGLLSAGTSILRRRIMAE